MGGEFRNTVNTTTKPSDHEFGGSKNMLPLWDLSKSPKDNSDHVKKLGKGDAAHGIAWREYDEKTKRATPSDGFSGPKPPDISTFALFDPDGVVLRLYDKEGKGKGTVWTNRLVAEHKEKAKERKHRSTIVVDNCPNQHWAWSQDQWWIINTSTKVDDKEIRFDNAGFLPQIKTPGAEGNDTRAALMLNLNKRGGHATDGKQYGQLWQALHISKNPGPAPVASPRDKVVTGQGNPGRGPGGETLIMPLDSGDGGTQSQECGKADKAQVTLRGDVIFHCGKELAPLAIGGKFSPTSGDPHTGHLWVNTPVPCPPDKELSKDDSSNHDILSRRFTRGLWCYVRIEKLPGIPPDDMHIPPNFPSKPPGVESPRVANSGLAVVSRYRAKGKPVATGGAMYVPENLTPDKGMNFLMNFMTPALGFTNTVDLQLDYVVLGRGDTTNPLPSLTGTQTQTIGPATHVGRRSDESINFFIPHSDLAGKEGGKIFFAFYRRADLDGNADDFDLVAKGCQYGLEINP